jgi:hypothetical protein
MTGPDEVADSRRWPAADIGLGLRVAALGMTPRGLLREAGRQRKPEEVNRVKEEKARLVNKPTFAP